MGPRLPDFLIVGAPKAGTTTLATDLGAHPALWIPRRKELGYFDLRWRTEDLDDYAAHFEAAPPTSLVGEATPTYLSAPGALERIAEAVPDVRLIAILRDPVARFWSHYWYNRTARLVENRDPLTALAEDPREYVEPGRYAHHLRRARSLFAPEQLLVLLLDDLVADRAAVYEHVCEHLGVAQGVPPGSGRARNSAYELRIPRLRTLMLRHSLWRRLPLDLGFKLDEWNRKPFTAPSMPPDVREQLREVFADDTAALADVLGRPVPWSSSGASEHDRPGTDAATDQ